MPNTDFQFNSLEEVLQSFPFAVTAALHSVRPLSHSEAALIRSAQTRLQVSANPSKENQIYAIELRGAALYQNGATCQARDTGPIYINYSYDPAREFWQDFVENDLVTILYQNRPVAIYNHETRALVQCNNDFSVRDWQGHHHPLFKGDALRASQAIFFLLQNNFIPQQSHQPRPIGADPAYYEWRNEPKKSSFSCLNVIVMLVAIFGALWLFLALVSAFG